MGTEPGTEVGERYVVEASIGTGGMGEVLRARDRRLDRVVALKVLPGARVGDAAAVARLIREARAAASLEHPGIVPVYDVGSTPEGGAFLAMQLVRGQTLRARLRAEGALPLADVRRVVGEVGAALAFAHDAGVVHRDVKPDNVMLRDADGSAVVLDFGLAKRLATGDEAALTAEGAMVGTPAYLAPEQARGREVDGRADQFALGVMTYELLTGRLPWKGASIGELLAGVLAEEPPSLEGEGVPAEVARAVARALTKEPADRFASIRDFLAAVGAPVSGADLGLAATVESGAVGAPSPVSGAAGGAVSGRLVVATLGLLVLGVASVGLLFVPERRQATRAGPASDAGAGDAPAMTMLTAPPPRGCTAQAAVAYDDALRLLHVGNWRAGCTRVREAAAGDPRCASVQLRKVQCDYFEGQADEARDAFQKAQLRKDSLTDREVALLDAFAPLLASSPPDRDEFRRRQARFPERFPRDAELLHYAALMSSASLEARLEWARRAIEIDPDYSDAHQSLGRVSLEAGREDDALAAFRRCAELAPSSSDCLFDAILLRMARGECEDALALVPTARARLGDPVHVESLEANLRASLGEPDEVTEAVGARLAPREPWAAALLSAHLAALRGHLVHAAELAEAARAEPDVPAADQRHFALVAAEARLELGEAERAAEAAAALIPTVERDLASVGVDERDAYAGWRVAELSRPVVTPERHARLLADWRSLRLRSYLPFPHQQWAIFEASQIDDPDDARRALAALGTDPPMGAGPSVLRFGGDVLRRAGEARRAVPYYERIAHGCTQLLYPFLTVRSLLPLGDAREAAGDHTGACEAYREVLARWGDAAPDAATVQTARERLSSCPDP